jgi:uncharacterized protein (DUF1697 family)
MPTFIALLRGVNVGKAKRVPMADLRNMLARLGYSDIGTLLNSGNAVFRAPGTSAAKHALAISAAIAERLGFEVPVIVKSAQDLAAIVAANPWAEAAADPSKLMVAFMQDVQGLAALQGIEALVTPPEVFAVGEQAAYLYCANGILESRAAEALLGKVGKAATTRNWATTLKLLALAHPAR